MADYLFKKKFSDLCLTKLVIRYNLALVIFFGLFQWHGAQNEDGNLLLPHRCCVFFNLVVTRKLLSQIEMVRSHPRYDKKM